MNPQVKIKPDDTKARIVEVAEALFRQLGYAKTTVADIAAMGVRRISVGGALARVAWHATIRAAREIAEAGKFDGFAGLISNPELNKFFHEDIKKQ